MRPFASTLALCLTLLASTAARAEIQRSGPEVFPSKHELTAHLGYQAGFGGQLGDVSGMKLFAEYAYRFHELVWFDVWAHNVFGFGARDGFCNANRNALCYRGGWAFGMGAGVKLKWVTPIPLVVEVPIGVGIDVLYNRECGDNGAAVPLGRVGAGVKYFLTQRIGLGFATSFTAGPGFHASSPCRAGGRYTDFYGAFDFMIGGEFLL